MELSFTIESITELDYDDISETIKQITPALDGENLSHTYIRDSAESDADSKAAVKTSLTDKGYIWDSEI